MFEEYHMRVLADVQQARKLMAPFLQAKTLSDLFDKVRLVASQLWTSPEGGGHVPSCLPDGVVNITLSFISLAC